MIQSRSGITHDLYPVKNQKVSCSYSLKTFEKEFKAHEKESKEMMTKVYEIIEASSSEDPSFKEIFEKSRQELGVLQDQDEP